MLKATCQVNLKVFIHLQNTSGNKAVTLLFQLGQQLVQHHHLSAVDHQVEVSGVRRARLRAIKQVGVVAAFPELHQHVQQTHFVHLTSRVQNVNILHQDLGVPKGNNKSSLYVC